MNKKGEMKKLNVKSRMAIKRFTEAKAQGLTPPKRTYEAVIRVAKDYENALKGYREMKKRGVKTALRLFLILVKKAPDFEEGIRLTEEIAESGGKPGVLYYEALYQKDITHISPQRLLEIYNSLPGQYEKGLGHAIATYEAAGMTGEALELCKFLPNHFCAIELYQRRPERSEAWFRRLVKQDPGFQNGIYGLGLCLFYNGRPAEAEPYLLKAREMAYAEKRKAGIDALLAEIDRFKEEGGA